MNSSILEGSERVRAGGGLTDVIHLHWQTGQGDKERRGGEEGLGLGQRDPEGEKLGRVHTERGETGRDEEFSWAIRESLLAESMTEGERMVMD